MATNRREFKNSPMEVGSAEEVAFTVDTTKYPGSGNATNPAAYLFDDKDKDISATGLSGTPTIDGSNVLKTPKVVGSKLTPGKRYRMAVRWTKDGNVFEPWGWIDCTK